MRTKDILKHPCRAMTQEQRASYFDNGFTLLRSFVEREWLDRLNAAVAKFVDQSRSLAKSGSVFDLEPDHTADNPRLRRVSSPCDQDEIFWRFLTESRLADALADVVGPDVKFYQAKLNFKWAKGGAEVAWHQDQPFFPHTNHAVLTCGIYLNECGPEQGPLMCIPGSHTGEIYNHYDEAGVWRGELRKSDSANVPADRAVELAGPAGSVTMHNYRTLHASRRNLSDLGRPLLLYVISAADAMPYTAQPLTSRCEQAMIRGEPARFAHHEPGHYRLPPDWSGGYTSIFASQQQEDLAAT